MGEKNVLASEFHANKTRVREIIDRVKENGRVNLLGIEALKIVEAYGIPTPGCRFAETVDEAIEAASELGYPVVLKVSSPYILHKTDVGGVKLDLRKPEEVKESFYEIIENVKKLMPHAEIYGVEVHKMVPLGKEVIVGAHKDPQFGPLVMFGLGGIFVEFLKDVSFRLAPLTKRDAMEMVAETKTYTLLKGVRGEPPSDIDAIVNVILRISQMVNDFKEICELDINPLFVYKRGEGCLALDARMTIAHAG
jgi:acetyltransferase